MWFIYPYSSRLLTHWPQGNLNEFFRYIIFKWILVIDGWGISCEIALIWMSLDFVDDQSTLVQVMAWCRQATSHYMSQCWLRSLSSYGVTRPQWVKPLYHRNNYRMWVKWASTIQQQNMNCVQILRMYCMEIIAVRDAGFIQQIYFPPFHWMSQHTVSFRVHPNHIAI